MAEMPTREHFSLLLTLWRNCLIKIYKNLIDNVLETEENKIRIINYVQDLF